MLKLEMITKTEKFTLRTTLNLKLQRVMKILKALCTDDANQIDGTSSEKMLLLKKIIGKLNSFIHLHQNLCLLWMKKQKKKNCSV